MPFHPNKTDLVKAIENKQLTTWSGLTATSVQNHLPESSTANDKGNMKRQHKGIRSTMKIPGSKTHKERIRVALEKIETEQDINPQKENEKNN